MSFIKPAEVLRKQSTFRCRGKKIIHTISEQAFPLCKYKFDDKVPKFSKYVRHRCSVHKVYICSGWINVAFICKVLHSAESKITCETW